MATNQKTKFSIFEIDVHDIKISGIYYLPSTVSESATDRPLILLIHGGTCSAHNFDVSPSLTASSAADYFSFPLVSINRPGYLGSTPLPIPEGSTFHKELGKFNHEHLFPALWQKYGLAQGCTALVPISHSLGSPGLIIAAGLHAVESQSRYPLAGFAFSGWGIHAAPQSLPPPPDDPNQKLPWKSLIMLGYPEHHCAPQDAHDALATQDQPIASDEMSDLLSGLWRKYWRTYSDAITVPIMYGLSEHDLFWDGSLSHLKEMEASFPNCPRFDGSLLLGAPHAIEWSWMSQAWYARCFGFAAEVTTTFAGKCKSNILVSGSK